MGIDLLEEIKKKNPNTIVIMLTNYPYLQYKKKCAALGADFFLDKPTEFAKLIKILRDIVKSKNMGSVP